MNRRLFLKDAMVTAAGTFAVPAAFTSHAAAKTSPGDKVNIGQIGCGRIARDHNLPEILRYDTARVTAVCDLDRKRMADGKQMIEDYYNKKAGTSRAVDVRMYPDYRDLLRDSSIDAVIISTPDHWHAQPAIEAALAGKVLRRKPRMTGYSATQPPSTKR